jgi:hypothetical protein
MSSSRRPDDGGSEMDDGMQWLARQIAWEGLLSEMRQDFADTQRASAPVPLPVRHVEIKAETATAIVAGNTFEAA